MKILASLALNIILVTGALAQHAPKVKANYQLAARFSPTKLKRMVFSTRVDPHWLKNSNRFWYSYETSEGKTYYIVDPTKNSRTKLFDNTRMAADMTRLTGDPYDAKHLDMEKIRFIKNESVLQFQVKSKLVKEEEKEDQEEEERGEQQEGEKKEKKKKKKMVDKIYYFEYTLSNRTLQLLADYEKPKDDAKWASVSPDETYVLFSRHFNLYWMDMANYAKALKDEKDSTIIENQLTEDGEEYYGYGGSTRGETNVDKKKNKDKRKRVGVVWSADSKKFAINRTDTRKVKDLWVIKNTANPRPTLETYKYPMPGEKNVGVDEIVIFDFDSKKHIKVKADTFPDQSVGISRATRLKKNRDDKRKPGLWLSKTSDKLYFTRTSRDLKRLDFCVANTTTGEVTVIIEERLNTYIEQRTPGLINNGKEFIQWSERDGWAHFYLYDGQGNLKNQITSGAYHVQNIAGIDEKNRVLYFTANGREKGEDPYFYHLYKVNFNGTGLKLLNRGDYSHTTNLNDASTHFVNNYSRVNTTPASVLYDNTGKKIMDLEKADLSKLMEAGYRFPEPFKVKAGDGITDLYGVMYKPFDFDSTRTYPLIEYVYPGPQTEAVNKSFSSRMGRLDRMAQFGFIVISIGNRGGHPARSKWYHNYGYGNLRDYGLEDKKVAAEQLAYRHDYIDISKVGIFGHSGGGFMSTAAMLVYPDFFKVAVSSSGNHENNVYNRWWSEKHHGIEEIINAKGEATFKYAIDKNPDLANNLKGRLLITTGDIDNNVHPANTIRMANALVKANKRFDYFVFPGQRHGYGKMSEYFFWLRADYFCQYLIGDYSNSVDMVEMNNEKPLKR
jgi:dipeptidyl-peptidase 4